MYSLLNLSAPVYEVIIAVGCTSLCLFALAQYHALRIQAKRIVKLKAGAVELGLVSAQAILDITNVALETINEYKEVAEEAEAAAEAFKREAMEAAADADDALDDLTVHRVGDIAQMSIPLGKSSVLVVDIDGPGVHGSRVFRVPNGADPFDVLSAMLADATFDTLANSPRPGETKSDVQEAGPSGPGGGPGSEPHTRRFPTGAQSPRAG